MLRLARQGDGLAGRALNLGFVVVVAALWVGAVGGCASMREAVVTVRFDNVRELLRDGKPEVNEWDSIRPIVMKRHVAKNRFGVEAETRSSTLPDPPHETVLRDYEVTLVVADLRELGDMQREISRLHGQRFASGRRFHMSLDSVELHYSGSYVQAHMTRAINGRTRPGALVYIFDGPGDPRVVPASETGTWSTPVNIAPGQQYIRGFSVLRGREKSVAARKHFRVDVFTGAHQELTAEEFAGGGPGFAERVGNFVGGVFQ
jgi:hypothetical protein